MLQNMRLFTSNALYLSLRLQWTVLGHRQGHNGCILGICVRVIAQRALRTHAHDPGVFIGIADGITIVVI